MKNGDFLLYFAAIHDILVKKAFFITN